MFDINTAHPFSFSACLTVEGNQCLFGFIEGSDNFLGGCTPLRGEHLTPSCYTATVPSTQFVYHRDFDSIESCDMASGCKLDSQDCELIKFVVIGR